MKNFIENNLEDNNLVIFHRAIKENRLDIINYYFTAGVNINHLQDGESAIHIATRFGKNDIVKLLVANGANIDTRNLQGFTSIDIALYKDNEELVEYFLKQRASFHFMNGAGEFCLHIAAQRSNITALKMLLEKGANPNIKNITGYTALDIACLNNNKEMVTLLLAYGACHNVQNIQDEALFQLPKEEVNRDLPDADHINKRKREASSFIDEILQETNREIAILLHKVVKSNNMKLVELYVNLGANLNLVVDRKTVLEIAISNNNMEIASFLLKQKTIKIPNSLEKKLITKICKGEICNEVEQLIVEKLGYYFKVDIVSEAVNINYPTLNWVPQTTIPALRPTYSQKYIV